MALWGPRVASTTSTQRPQKVHDEVLSQSDNMLLMRMNSEADLGHLRDAFSFVPDGLIQRATTFRQGPTPRTCGLVSDSPRTAAPTYQCHGLPRGDSAQASRKVTPSRLARSSRPIP
jgi:hypothetical protein